MDDVNVQAECHVSHLRLEGCDPVRLKSFSFCHGGQQREPSHLILEKKNEYLIHLLLPFFQLPHDEIGLLLKLLPNLSLFFFLSFFAT